MKYLKVILSQATIVQLLLALTCAVALTPLLNLTLVTLCYTISLNIINVLFLLLPFIVFGLVLHALVSLNYRSVGLLVSLFIGVTLSNVVALCYSYTVGQLFLPYFISTVAQPVTPASTLEPYFSLPTSTFITTESALMMAVSWGVMGMFLQRSGYLSPGYIKFVETYNRYVRTFLVRYFIPIVPVYIFGFTVKLCYEGTLTLLFLGYGKVFIMIIMAMGTYVIAQYVLAAFLSGQNLTRLLRQMMPATLTGFSTMSSAAAMPVTLRCCENMSGDKSLSSLVIPITANIHMIGDAISITLMAMVIQKMSAGTWMDASQVLTYAFAFSFAKLSCVGLPGASILVVLPVLTRYFEFSPEMISLITTLYILQDPIGTATNVISNGAFVMNFKYILRRYAPQYKT